MLLALGFTAFAQSGQQEVRPEEASEWFDMDEESFFDRDRANAIREVYQDFEYRPAPQPVPDTLRSPVPVETADRVAEEIVIPGAKPGGVVMDNDVVAFYGHPRSNRMGILGEADLPETFRILEEVAAEWDRANGPRGVYPAFHLIFATVHADANVGYMRPSDATRYIEFAAERGGIVILDHQLGRFDVVESVRTMLPYLHYENVHLAIDPEWSTEIPGQEIGSVTAADINAAQQLISEYLIENDLSRPRMFLVHQFNWRMIEDREEVRSDFPAVELIHNADGFGSPDDKLRTYEYLALAENMPLKGFKLFYPKDWRAGGFDVPLMTPTEVLNLRPRPVVIQYQ